MTDVRLKNKKKQKQLLADNLVQCVMAEKSIKITHTKIDLCTEPISHNR